MQKSNHNTLSSGPRNRTKLALLCGLGLSTIAKLDLHVLLAPCSIQIFLDYFKSC